MSGKRFRDLKLRKIKRENAQVQKELLKKKMEKGKGEKHGKH